MIKNKDLYDLSDYINFMKDDTNKKENILYIVN
jgi:hypothetical protein